MLLLTTADHHLYKLGIPNKVENLKSFSYPTYIDLIWDHTQEALDYCITFITNSSLVDEICHITENTIRWNRSSTSQPAFIYHVAVTARGTTVDKGPPSNSITDSFYSIGEN